MSVFTGSGVAIITPFKENGDVDFDALRSLLDFQIEGGTDAIVICGTTGEASTMTDEEQVEVVRFTVEHVNKRVPVVAGAGSNNTEHGIALSKSIEATGADALLHVTPYYNKTSQQGLYEHFMAIADAVSIPIILYNVPGRTGMDLKPETVARLAQHKNIVGIKDATGNLAVTVDLRALCGEDFDIYSGNDDVTVPVLACGGVGVISVLANIAPSVVHEITEKWFNGDLNGAIALQAKYQKLVHTLFMEPNPIPVKEAANMMGLPGGFYRKPMVGPSEHTINVLGEDLRSVGLLEEA